MRRARKTQHEGGNALTVSYSQKFATVGIYGHSRQMGLSTWSWGGALAFLLAGLSCRRKDAIYIVSERWVEKRGGGWLMLGKGGVDTG